MPGKGTWFSGVAYVAIYRKCKYCGQPISLRLMPAGHWVAFDLGTDNVHGCVKGAVSMGRFPNVVNVRPVRTPAGAYLLPFKRPAAKTDPDTLAATGPQSVRALLEKAQRELRCVKLIYYTASRHAVTERVVEPLALEPYRRGTLLHAYCRWRQDFRRFALTNIRRAELMDETFVPRPLPASRATPQYRASMWQGSSSPPASRSARPASESQGCIWWLILGGIALMWVLLKGR